MKWGNDMKTEFIEGEFIANEGTDKEKVVPCVYVGGQRLRVYETEQGYKYFKIKNPYAPWIEKGDVEQELAAIFSGRLGDALKTVQEGYADALFMNDTIIGDKLVRPVVFLDRTFGEACRQKTLEGFKDVEFGYTVKFGNKQSMYGYSFVNTNNKKGVYDDEQPVFFKTEQKAQAYIDNCISEAKLLAMCGEEELKKEFKKRGSARDIVMILAFEIYENGDDYGFKVVQHIKENS